MRKLFVIVVAVLLTVGVFAQTPEKLSYQAVIRNASGELVTEQAVGMQISILQGSASGTAVYVETQSSTTNVNGLVSIEIGTGTSRDDFSAIDWSADTYFIKTETDLTGGSSYSIIGVSQLLSVPYALHAKTAETITGGITETDPVYTASEASNVTATDIANLGNLSGINTGDQDISGIAINAEAIKDTAAQIRADMPDVSGYISTETDPVYTASEASNITATDIANLGNLSGTNTGDQDISGIATNTQAIKDTASQIRTALVDTATALRAYVDEKAGGDAHYVGELYGGGIVFYVYDNGEHGLIASLDDLSDRTPWGGYGTDITNCESGYDGAANTTAIVQQLGSGDTHAAGLCNSYRGGNHSDWYLPASWELNLLYNAAFAISHILDNDGNSETNGLAFIATVYWSSTEYASGMAWIQQFNYGNQTSANKRTSYRVRAVRRF